MKAIILAAVLQGWLGPGWFSVCDTQEQAAAVVAAHKELGFEGAKAVFDRLMDLPGFGGSACGTMLAKFRILRVVWQGKLDFPAGPRLVTMAEIEVDGLAQTFFGILVGVEDVGV